MFNYTLSSLGGDLKNAFGKKVESFTAWFMGPSDDGTIKLKMDIVGAETLSVSSNVTDNYTENNTAYQNHISRAPIVYTIEGSVGELTYYKKDEDNSILGSLPNKLTTVTTFIPSLSKKTFSVMDKATKALNMVDSVDNAVTRFRNLGEKLTSSGEYSNLQQKEYLYLISLWYDRKPISIKTPWHNFPSMVITNIEFSQTRVTKEITNIKISFKEFREVSRKTTKFSKEKYKSQTALAQNEILSNNGNTTGSTMFLENCKDRQWCPDLRDGGLVWE